ncbi:MAG: hypothetical protein LBP28_06915 [Coriobacteriales bacterium]|jgi:hypothetical protein|nr:hypothetical protein [Coriobacteriales bacterium]
MSEKYSYRGKNLTTLILAKLEHVACIIADREQITFEQAYREFMQSRAFENLRNTETQLWGESAEFIVDDYYRERSGGD